MKKAITICVMISNFFIIHAQEKKVGIMPMLSNPIKDAQVGWFDIDNESFDNYNVRNQSYAIGLLANYSLKESLIRLRLNYNRFEMVEEQDYFFSGTNYFMVVGGFQNRVTIAPGIAWRINNNKLQLFFGFELPINLVQEFKMTFVTTETDSLTGIRINDSFGEQEIPSGLSFGIGGIFGFNYFIKPYFSIGSEFSPSLLFAKLGGQTTGNHYSTTPAPGYAIEFKTEDKMQGFTFIENRFSIGFSFWF